MKIFVVLLFFSFLKNTASAQYGMPAREAVIHLNDSIQVSDKVIKMKIKKDTTFLEIGIGTKKHRLLVVLVANANKEFEPLSSGYPIGFYISLHGVVKIYKNRPCIILTEIYDDVVIVH